MIQPENNLEREAVLLIGLLEAVITKYRHPHYVPFGNEKLLVQRFIMECKELFIQRLGEHRIDPNP